MMHIKSVYSALAGVWLLAAAVPGLAHTPVFTCSDNQDGTISCQANFSDGASAEGIDVRLAAASGRVLARKQINAENRVEFEQPDDDFTVVFDAGDGHSVTVFGDDID